jgi:SAM-dependent methyltransferase
MTRQISNAYEVRNANYSIVHSESDADFNEFFAMLDIRDGERVIDVGGGYGPIFTRLIEQQPSLRFEYDLLDGGLFQLKKAEERINLLLKKIGNNSAVRYLHQDATRLDLQSGYYDLVICKMFLHEIPKQHKKNLIAKLFDILKPGGRLIAWNPDLNDGDHGFFSSLIRKKDELAGFESMVQNRHFLLNSEMAEMMNEAGFSGFKKLLTFDYHLSTRNRLVEEFAGDNEKLREWNEYILTIAKQLDDNTRKQLRISVSGDDIYINFKRGVFSSRKPKF